MAERALTPQERVIHDAVLIMTSSGSSASSREIQRDLIQTYLPQCDAGTSPMGGVLMTLADWLASGREASIAWHRVQGAVVWFLARRQEASRRACGETIGGAE